MPVETINLGPLLEAMGRLKREVGRINLQLGTKSPARAGLKTITDQLSEVGTILTGDPHYFDGKAHTMPTAFKPEQR